LLEQVAAAVVESDIDQNLAQEDGGWPGTEVRVEQAEQEGKVEAVTEYFEVEKYVPVFPRTKN
jgi:hypothetical protein